MKIQQPIALLKSRGTGIARSAVLVAVFACLGFFALQPTRAATYATTVEAENGTTSGNASTISDTNASGGNAVKFGTSTTPPPGELYGWQLTSTNTGLAPHGLSCASLPVYTGPTKPAAGTVISQKRITVEIDASNGNITIDKSCIQSTTASSGFGLVNTFNPNTSPETAAPAMVTVTDSEFDGSAAPLADAAGACGFRGGGTVLRSYFHNIGNGVCYTVTGLQLDIKAEGNYVTALTGYGDPATTGTHNEAMTVRGFDTSQNPNRRAVVRNNRFNCAEPANCSGAFFIQTFDAAIDQLTVEGNLLEGDNYRLTLSLNGNSFGTHLYATNNRFTYNAQYGPANADSGVSWTTWSENYFNDPTKTGNKGTAIPAPN